MTYCIFFSSKIFLQSNFPTSFKSYEKEGFLKEGIILQEGFPKTPSAATKVAIYFVLSASSTKPELTKSTNESYSLDIAFRDDDDDQGCQCQMAKSKFLDCGRSAL